MTFWRQFTAGVRSLLHRPDAERDLTDEVASYIEEAVADLVVHGTPEHEARRLVRLQYGDGLAAREDVRGHGWENVFAERGTDLRRAIRRLSRDKGFTTVAVLTLGLGVGAATAIYGVVRPVLFDALPYPDSGRLVSIADRSAQGAIVPVTFGTFLEVSARNEAFVSLAVSKPWQPTLTGSNEPERVEGLRVSSAYFDVLGVAPVLGGGFDPSADLPGGADLVVLSDALWRARFEADPSIIGRTIQLDARPFRVVGVMAPAFEDVTAPTARAWALLQYEPIPVDFDGREWGHHLDMMARLNRDVSLDEARRQMAELAAQPMREYVRPSWASLDQGWAIRSLRESVASDARPTAWVLLGAAMLLLVIACVNLSLLMLARESRRSGELSLRLVLGAGRARLASYVLTENLVLAALGGALGLIVATVGVAVLVAASPTELPQIAGASVNLLALGPALTVTGVLLAAFGLGAAFRQSEQHAPATVRGAGRGISPRATSARRLLVMTEVAVAVVLLIGAGLIVRSTQNILAISPGFETSGSIVFRIYGTGLEPGPRATHRFFDDALAAVERVPGVASAGLTNQLPLSGEVDMYGVTLDEPGRDAGVDGSAYRYTISPSYLATMGIALRRGRALEQQDLDAAVPSIVISESLSDRLFVTEDPIGQRLHFGAVSDEPFAVVGVVADVKQASLASQQLDAVYIPARQWRWADQVRWLVVRTQQDPELIVPAVREAIWSVDADQPVVQIQSASDLVARSEAQRRFVLLVLLAFSLSAVSLAAIGLYGVVSSSVSERAQEIGVRGALGASGSDIVTLVVRRAMTMTAIGSCLGLGVAVIASRTLDSLLFDVSRVDVATYAGVMGLLALVAAVACALPAARAARMDPVVTLRAE